jgi:hypothetical protein
MILGDSIRRESWIPAERVAEAMRGPGGSPRAIFIRPPTKKALREAVTASPEDVFVEETSVFGNEFEGWLSDAPEGHYHIVGPDPQRKRSWFATIRWAKGKGWIVD